MLKAPFYGNLSLRSIFPQRLLRILNSQLQFDSPVESRILLKTRIFLSCIRLKESLWGSGVQQFVFLTSSLKMTKAGFTHLRFRNNLLGVFWSFVTFPEFLVLLSVWFPIGWAAENPDSLDVPVGIFPGRGRQGRSSEAVFSTHISSVPGGERPWGKGCGS